MRISDWSSDVCSSDLQYGLKTLDHDRTAGNLIALISGNHVHRVDVGRVIGQYVRQLLQPEFRQFSQHYALAGNGIVKNDIEGRDAVGRHDQQLVIAHRSEEHTSELQSLMRISYAVFCLKKKIHNTYQINSLNSYRTFI